LPDPPVHSPVPPPRLCSRWRGGVQVCPYYGSRRALPEADIVLAPYSAVLHPETRASLGIELQGNVVGGHRLPGGACAGAGVPSTACWGVQCCTPPLARLARLAHLALARLQLVFDEAHNLLDAINSTHSVTITGACLAASPAARGVQLPWTGPNLRGCVHQRRQRRGGCAVVACGICRCPLHRSMCQQRRPCTPRAAG